MSIAPPSAPDPAEPTPTGSARVVLSWRRAAAASAWVNLYCAAILAALGVGIVAVIPKLNASMIVLDDSGLIVSGMVYGVHLVALLVVGFPVGWLLSRYLGPAPRRGTAALAFAGVGAAAGAALLAVTGNPAAITIWAVLGAFVPATARLWAHRRLARP